MPGEYELKVFSLGTVKSVSEDVYIALFVLIVIGTIFLMWRKGLREGFRLSMILLLAEWVFLIFGICVLFRESDVERSINLIPLSSYFDIAENTYFIEKAALNVLNVAMFVPVGLLLGLGFRGMTWKKMFLTCLTLSILTELLQFIFKRGLCETDDVIHNVLGAAIGFGIYCILAWIWGKGKL